MWKLQYTGRNAYWYDCDRGTFTMWEAAKEARRLSSFYLPEGSTGLPAWRYRAVPIGQTEGVS